MKRIYLDHAATSHPLPEGVKEAFCDAACLGNPGRSGHALSMKAANIVYETREKISGMFGVMPDKVIFTSGATAALNQAIFGCYNGGSVVMDIFAHNAVLRPLHALSQQTGAQIRCFSPVPNNPVETVKRFENCLDRNTRMAVVNGSSNICSAILPISLLGDICRRRGILLIVDGAQCAGKIPCNLEQDGVDIYCVPGHKGLQGVMGCGAMLLSPSCKTLPRPYLFGGSGSFAREKNMPEALPDHLEAGTLPLPAIAALGAGVAYVQKVGIEEISYREEQTGLHAAEGLSVIKGITIYAYPGATFVFSHKNISCEDIARQLDAYGICVRSGLHCAPLSHEHLGTPRDGAVRVSTGVFTNHRDIDSFLCAVTKIVS
ncbi:MAG TPA: cysteine desulfurase [Clostridiales bacterium]|nr:cysteine desulfurase [Clostridiales bacterium]